MKHPLIATFGADPELFLVNRSTNRIVNAIPVLKNDKHTPMDLGDGIRLYADNALAEFSLPPCYDKGAFVTMLGNAFQRIQIALGNEYILYPKAAHVFAKEEIPQPKAWEAGCDPNFCVYTEDRNPAAEFTDGLRTGSFHIHLGNAEHENEHKGCERLLDLTTKLRAIRLMDIFVGCSSVLFDQDPTSSQRRSLYGKAGEFRQTPYGIEYRCLGPWALSSPSTVGLVMDLVDHVLAHIRNGTDMDVLAELDRDTIIEAINKNNRVLARAMLSHAELPDTLMQRVQGVEKSYDFQSEWKLT